MTQDGRRRVGHGRRRACLLGAFFLAVGCSTPETTPSPESDVATATDTPVTAMDAAGEGDIGAGITCSESWTQGYCIRFTFHGGKNDGQSFTLQRDLTGTSGTIVYGSTHLQPPAVALSITDTWSLGVNKNQLQFWLDFGNLIEAPGFPAYLPKAGDYPFSCLLPSIQINYKNIIYRSTCKGLPGSVTVSKWGASQGDEFIGHFAGTLQQHLTTDTGASDCDAAVNTKRCAVSDVTVEVAGTFGATLPAKDAAVAP